jgi:hypothetical protein
LACGTSPYDVLDEHPEVKASARRVAIEKQRRRRTTLSGPAKAWGLVLDGLVGYGYRTRLAALRLLGFLALGTWIFAAAHPQAMTPTKPLDELPAFQPAVYALDVLLPIVDLRQATGLGRHHR